MRALAIVLCLGALVTPAAATETTQPAKTNLFNIFKDAGVVIAPRTACGTTIDLKDPVCKGVPANPGTQAPAK